MIAQLRIWKAKRIWPRLIASVAVWGAAISSGCVGGMLGPRAPGPAASYEEHLNYCLAHTDGAPRDRSLCEQMASRQAGPQIAEHTEAEWAELENQAKAQLNQSRVPNVMAPVRLTDEKRGYLSHAIPMIKERCYVLALTWSVPYSANISISLQRPENGKPGPSKNIGQRGFPIIKAPQGTVRVCTDGNGVAMLNVSMVDPERKMMVTGERLQYALAVGWQKESPTERRARHKQEVSELAESRAQVEANFYLSEVEQHGEGVAKGCQKCRNSHHTCSKTSSTSQCDAQFEACVHGIGWDNRGRKVCNALVIAAVETGNVLRGHRAEGFVKNYEQNGCIVVDRNHIDRRMQGSCTPPNCD